jgi:hypothetical protein
MDEHNCRIRIDISELGYVLTSSESDHCLDFKTGAIVPRDACPDEDTGEGRPALRQGKRYIVIPANDEAYREIEERYDLPRGDCRNPTMEEFLDRENSVEVLALNWIACLRPSFVVECVEEGLGITMVYNPESGKWEKAM